MVTDRTHVFVSSAKFTDAAQERNLEVGLLIRSSRLAGRLAEHFQTLLANHLLEPLRRMWRASTRVRRCVVGAADEGFDRALIAAARNQEKPASRSCVANRCDSSGKCETPEVLL